MPTGTEKAKRRVERRHHKVDRLPKFLRDQLADRFQQGETYDELVRWLDTKGYKVGRSSIHRWGREFENNLRDLKVLREQAACLVGEMAGKPATELNELAEQTAVQSLLELQMAARRLRVEGGAEDEEVVKRGTALAARAAHALASLGHSASERERVKLEFNKRFAASRKAAAEAAKGALEASGATKESVVEVVDKILGIGG
jgi:hypothetical protein